MNELLKVLLSLSLSGGLLIALLLLAKPLLKDRLSKRWQYGIWLLVIIRLLLPLAPETSLMAALFQSGPQVSISADQRQLPEPGPSRPDAPLAAIPDSPTDPEPSPSPAADEPDSSDAPSLAAVLLLIWLLVAACLLIRKITLYQSFVQYLQAGQKEIADMQLWERVGRLVEQMGIKRPVGLYTNSLISSPLLLGFRRPVIMLPTADLADVDLENTLRHELTHYKHRDMFYKWLVQATICLHWFNPLVHVMGREVNRACELACDEAVMQTLDAGGRRAYGDTLLRAAAPGGSYKAALASITLHEGTALLKERLDAVMKFKQGTRLSSMLALLLVALLCCGATAAGAYTPTQPQPQPEAVAVSARPSAPSAHAITVPIAFEAAPSGEFIWLGQYELAAGDQITYDVAAVGGSGLQTGLAAPQDDPLNRTYLTISNKRENGTLENKGSFTVAAPMPPGPYRLFLRATDGDLAQISGSITILSSQAPSPAIAPSLTIDLQSAAVTLERAADDHISADYNSSVYAVSINQTDSDWQVDIASKSRSNTEAEAIKLYLPDIPYDSIRLNADSAYLTSAALPSGHIQGHFATSSVLLTLPQGFTGSLDAVADGGYFELTSLDGFRNTQTTVIDAGQYGQIYTPKGFTQKGDTYSYTHGAQSNAINVTRQGIGVIELRAASDADDNQREWEKRWQPSWQKSWLPSYW